MGLQARPGAGMMPARLHRPRLAILALHPVQYHAPLYREIAASGAVDLTVLYCARRGNKPQYEEEWDVALLDGYRHHFLLNLGRVGWPQPLSRINPGVVSWLVRERYDVLMIQGYTQLTDWLALLAAKSAGTKVIFRGEATPGSHGRLSGHPLKHRAAATMIRYADRVLYSCTGNRLWFEEHGAERARMALIPCAVDNVFFEAQRAAILANPLSPKRQIGLDDGVLHVASVANMIPRKRLHDLVAAVARLQEGGLPAGLILVGDGPERERLASMVGELAVKDAHIVGWANQRMVCGYNAAADVFVVASDYDPSPKALSEALLFGLPVVCADAIGTAADLVADGENGYLFPAGDVEALAHGLSLILQDPDLRAAMGRRSLAIAAEWSMAAAARSVVQAVELVLNGR
ncbi:MAG: glycosyltransferase family 4 protein [Anaerolineae bacterium]|jgi:glycosyltransferase involved in cell wall biosynthesis|nr:glycosyltransferase family 4 protein [Anaerolineae bacterium]MDX9829572.1 glycosyltransferase family 4 protein [Anaerolineae bacterium]